MAKENSEFTSVYLLHLELENIRCFKEKVEIDFTGKDGKWKRWNIILGDNGMGKSTLLQCIDFISNVYFNIKDQHNCVSQNSNSFSIKTYDPVKPINFNYSAFYKENYIIPTKKDSGYILYNWNPGMYLNFTDKPDPTFNGENSTDYVLLRTDTTSKCMVADNYHIDVTREYILDVPNAFTPNYDGLNDRLRIIANEGIESIESFIIINREGIQVFPKPGQVWSSTPAKDPMDIRGATGWNTWDGKDAQGRMLESDGYYWKATYYIKPNHTPKYRTGMFLLLK